MVKITKRSALVNQYQHWFEYRFNWSSVILPCSYYGIRKESIKGFYFGIRTHTQTVVLCLLPSVENLYAAFSTSHKRYIKKAEASGVYCYTNHDRAGFIKFYNDFAKSKGLYTLDLKNLQQFEEDKWLYSYAVSGNQIVAAHSYMQDKKLGIVRLMESGSLRLDENFDPGKVAQANKLLHYFDIKYFKEKGFSEYDFGGWDNIPGLLEFKQSFGAMPIPIYNYLSFSYFFRKESGKIYQSVKQRLLTAL